MKVADYSLSQLFTMKRNTSYLDHFALEELGEFVVSITQEEHDFTSPVKDERGERQPILTSCITSEFLIRTRGVSPQHNVDTNFMQLYRYLKGKPEVDTESASTFAADYCKMTRIDFVKDSVEEVKMAMALLQNAESAVEYAVDVHAEKKTVTSLAALQREEEAVKTLKAHLLANLAVSINYMKECELINHYMLI